jgi:hypothetical protein
MRQKIINTAHLTEVETRDTLRDHLKVLYPENNINIWVWSAGNECRTGF